MTQNELNEKIAELQKQIDELKQTKVEAEQPKRWKPKDDETYWAVTASGCIDTYDWENDNVDNLSYLTGNCFKTEKEAEEHKKQIEYTARYKNYIEEHSEPLDWNNLEQTKCSGCYDFDDKKIMFDENNWFKIPGVIYASSREIIEDAIKEIGEDNFKKYVLGVK